MKIFGFQKTSLLDYPAKIAAILFTGGCNFRCPYCHNSELLSPAKDMPTYATEEILAYLKKRQGILEGVVISGGECTLSSDLPDLCEKIKQLGYSVKIDTNGTDPEMLSKLIHEGLVDYIAMDIKNSKEKYAETVGLASAETAKQAERLLSAVCESAELLMEGRVAYEFRITVVSQLHTAGDFHAIGAWIKGADACYLQPYAESDGVAVSGLSAPSKDELLLYQSILNQYVKHTDIRGNLS